MRFNRYVFLNRPMLSLETHLGVTTSPQAPFPADFVTLPVSGKSPPLRLTSPRSRRGGMFKTPCIPSMPKRCFPTMRRGSTTSRRTVGDVSHPEPIRAVRVELPINSSHCTLGPPGSGGHPPVPRECSASHKLLWSAGGWPRSSPQRQVRSLPIAHRSFQPRIDPTSRYLQQSAHITLTEWVAWFAFTHPKSASRSRSPSRTRPRLLRKSLALPAAYGSLGATPPTLRAPAWSDRHHAATCRVVPACSTALSSRRSARTPLPVRLEGPSVVLSSGDRESKSSPFSNRITASMFFLEEQRPSLRRLQISCLPSNTPGHYFGPNACPRKLIPGEPYQSRKVSEARHDAQTSCPKCALCIARTGS